MRAALFWTARFVHIRDLDAELGVFQSVHDFGRTTIALPLLRDGAAIGAISMNTAEFGGFTDSQVALLQTFAEQAVIAITSAETYRALQERTAALTQRNTEYSERIQHQAATIDVLKAMSASPGDTRPVFELIVRRAAELRGGSGSRLMKFDGTLVHASSSFGMPAEANARYLAMFPRPPFRELISCRAILEKRVIHVRDLDTDPDVLDVIRATGRKSQLAVPLMRDDTVIGAITLSAAASGGYSDSQVALLETFAEQAVIAITSAETYRALQTRTSDLQESLEYQTATSDVLKVIGGSTFDLQPVFDTIVTTAARLCEAGYANITTRESDGFRVVAGYSNLPDRPFTGIGRSFPVDRNSITGRTVLAQQFVHLMDVTLDPEYVLLESARRTGMRSILGVPLIRDGVVVGTLNLGRVQVRPFTGRQIDLIRTFADQAVIAMENARLITETREALEQQTATAEVLQVINASPGNLAPVFEAILEKAHNLCDVAVGSLSIYLDGIVHTAATRGFSEEYQALLRRPYPAIGSHQALMRGGPSRQTPDFRTVPVRPEMASSLDHFDRMNLRTGLWVPLRKDGTALGCISSYRDKVATVLRTRKSLCWRISRPRR